MKDAYDYACKIYLIHVIKYDFYLRSTLLLIFSDVSYLMKTDDDMYINIKELYNLVAANKDPHLLTGALICGAKPLRDPHNKWHSPYYMYQETVYPPYVSGTGYVMSSSTALILFKMALTVPAFHLEDVYITGILPTKVSEFAATRLDLLPATGSNKIVIKPKDDYRFSFFLAKNDACIYNKIISSHHLTMNEVRTMYQKVLNVRSKPEDCPKLKPKQLRPYSPGKCTKSKLNKVMQLKRVRP